MADESKKDDLLRVRVDGALLKALEDASKARGVDQSKIVREAIRQHLGLEPPPGAAAPVDMDALERAVAVGAERVLERLAFLEAEIPGRVEVVLRAGLAGLEALAVAQRVVPVPQRTADVATDVPRGTDELEPPAPARPPVDPAEVVKAFEERLRAAETLGQLRTLMEDVERSGLPKALKNQLYDVWMECEAAVRLGRKPPTG